MNENVANTIIRTPAGGILRQGDAEDALQATKGGYDLVVLCAKEWQPPANLFVGPVHHVQLDDAELSKREVHDALLAAFQVARNVKKGKRVLVTCWQGRNRSGLVSALALRMLHGVDGKTARKAVQLQRKNALTNPSFVRFLDSLGAPRRPT